MIKAFKSRRLRWAGHIARMGDGRRAYDNLLLEKLEGNHACGRPKIR